MKMQIPVPWPWALSIFTCRQPPGGVEAAGPGPRAGQEGARDRGPTRAGRGCSGPRSPLRSPELRAVSFGVYTCPLSLSVRWPLADTEAWIYSILEYHLSFIVNCLQCQYLKMAHFEFEFSFSSVHGPRSFPASASRDSLENVLSSTTLNFGLFIPAQHTTLRVLKD